MNRGVTKYARVAQFNVVYEDLEHTAGSVCGKAKLRTSLEDDDDEPLEDDDDDPLLEYHAQQLAATSDL